MSEYNGTYEFVFFHDQKKGEIIVIMNGQKHVFNDGVAKAVKAERERIAKWAEEAADEYGKLDLFDILDQVEEPHTGAKHDPNCNIAQGKWDGGCTCKPAAGYQEFKDKVIQENPEEYLREKSELESDPRQLHVIGKKPEVADRTLNERKYCAIDDFYYSEMFTCPICYGVGQERERIIKLIQENMIGRDSWLDAIELIKGEQK